jgi:hypothetical protein
VDGDNRRLVGNVNPYLTEHFVDIVPSSRQPLFIPVPMDYGVYYSKSAGLILEPQEARELYQSGFPTNMMRRFLGSTEFINGHERSCLWIADADLETAQRFPEVRQRIESVRRDRLATEDTAVNKLAARPHQFRERKGEEASKILIPIVSSENREYFPVGLVDGSVIPTNKMFYIANAPLWCLSILSSKLHLAWIAAICGRLRSDYSYSNTLGWNTFPLPALTEKNIADLTRCAEEILLAREMHFPSSLADLYEVKEEVVMMPPDLIEAHERNDEVLERFYIGRRFRNDTERLEKLFDLYTKMAASPAAAKKKAGVRA